MPDQPPRLDRYEILSKIGSGGFATVYRARDTRTQREVALKVIEGRHAQEKEFVDRFNQEALTAAGLRHPRIVTIYDFGEVEGALYLAMELIQGRTLRELLTQRKLLPLNEALSGAMPQVELVLPSSYPAQKTALAEL
jgi:serine/threonine-protein kinase